MLTHTNDSLQLKQQSGDVRNKKRDLNSSICLGVCVRTVPQVEAGHNIGQFGDFRRSGQDGGTLEITAAPRTQNQHFNHEYSFQQIIMLCGAPMCRIS